MIHLTSSVEYHVALHNSPVGRVTLVVEPRRWDLGSIGHHFAIVLLVTHACCTRSHVLGTLSLFESVVSNQAY